MAKFVQLIAWFQAFTISNGLTGLLAMSLLALILALSLSLVLASKL